MRHYIYPIMGHEPDPLGIGDAKSWFYFYKWPDEGETFLPVSAHYGAGIDVGDRLWLCVDYKVIGSVVIERIEDLNETLPNASRELWYDAAKKLDVSQFLIDVLDDFHGLRTARMKEVAPGGLLQKLEEVLAKST